MAIRAQVQLDSQSFRGDAMEVRGRLVDDTGLGMAGRRVDIFLAPAGADGAGAVTIGHAVTDANGEFAARAEVPAALDVGDYEVYASFRGDDSFRPALSD